MTTGIRSLVTLFTAGAAVLCGWAGCGEDAAGGNGRATSTRGQELIDLKRALEVGALSQTEYDREREKVLQLHA